MADEFEDEAVRESEGEQGAGDGSPINDGDVRTDVGDDRGDDASVDAPTASQLAARAAWAVRGKNMLTPGSLTVHYVTRDVRLVVDGDAGLRAISAWRGQLECIDDLNHRYSTAEAGWVGIDLAHVIGMTWMPDSAGIDVDRITIDPIC